MSARVVLTYQDLGALPADGRRYELHEGELSVTAAPVPAHQRVLFRLAVALDRHVRARGLGEVLISPIDCIFSDITAVQPDIVYVAVDRAGAVSPRGIEGPPTLAIEILSPSTAAIDRGVKLQLYARYGVPYYWIVDIAARSIEAHVLEGAGYRRAPDGFPPFSGFWLDLPTLFA